MKKRNHLIGKKCTLKNMTLFSGGTEDIIEFIILGVSGDTDLIVRPTMPGIWNSEARYIIKEKAVSVFK